MRSIWLLSLVTFFSLNSFASGFKGSVSFTAEEKAAHLAALPVIMQTAAECLQTDLKRQHDFINAYGISAFYGDHSRFSRMTTEEKQNEIESCGADPELLKYMQPTSCVGMTRKCLGRGFEAGGQAYVWQRIDAYTQANGVDGSAMQDALQKLGWKILYWNPSVSMNKTWDARERAKNPKNSDHFWGYHEENWINASQKGRYYLNKVDDAQSLVNFGKKVPAAIKNVPFFVGTAHMGYHVFPGTFGQIIEAHSTRAINDPLTVQSAPFNPLGGGGPTDGEYFSGIVAIPPGY